jgi:hypothetical protein
VLQAIPPADAVDPILASLPLHVLARARIDLLKTDLQHAAYGLYDLYLLLCLWGCQEVFS